jgi:hypothetical protein
MVKLHNASWERFAQLLAAGLTQTGAYRGAGYKAGEAARYAASQLAKRDCVRLRVQELQQEQLTMQRERRTGGSAPKIDRPYLQRKGAQILEGAFKAEEFDTASRTLVRIAKLSGLWKERQAPGGEKVIEVYSAPLTEEEWLRLYVPQEWERLYGPGAVRDESAPSTAESEAAPTLAHANASRVVRD